MAYHDFTEMPVWQLCSEIVGEVYELSAKLPKCEDYALRGQVRSAAVSITGNIAEGFGRGHTRDKIHFYLFSRGSAYEVISHLLMGVRVKYFSNEEVSTINAKCSRVVEELNRIIKGLQNSLDSKS